jgi:hypothetical protein
MRETGWISSNLEVNFTKKVTTDIKKEGVFTPK